jgi:hypothetical protein
MAWKGRGRKWSWHSFKLLLWYLTGEIEENHEKLVSIASLQAKI